MGSTCSIDIQDVGADCLLSESSVVEEFQQERLSSSTQPYVELSLRGTVFASSSSCPVESVYTFGDQIGTGTYGHVSKATSKRFAKEEKQDFAIKTMLGKDPKAMNNGRDRFFAMTRRRIFESERQLLAVLEHPHITHLMGAFQNADNNHEGPWSLVLELCSGGELYNRIVATNRIPEELAQRMFWQMVITVAYLRSSFIVHRDLKPENWIFTHPDSDVVKLCDFGTAIRMPSVSSRSYAAGGTLAYMAPEAFEEKGVSFAADDWGLGIVLYTMVIGRHPFKSANQPESVVISRIRMGDYEQQCEQWSLVSDECKVLVSELLCATEVSRLQSTSALHKEWVEHGKICKDCRNLALGLQLVELIGRFSQLDELQRAVLVLATRFPTPAKPHTLPGGADEHSIPWYDLFLQWDSDNDGRLSSADIVSALSILPGAKNETDPDFDSKVAAAIARLDVDQSGYIDWCEWCALPLLQIALSDDIFASKEPVASLFRLFDAPTGDGVLCVTDLSRIIAPGSDSMGLVQKWGEWSDITGEYKLDMADLCNVVGKEALVGVWM